MAERRALPAGWLKKLERMSKGSLPMLAKRSRSWRRNTRRTFRMVLTNCRWGRCSGRYSLNYSPSRRAHFWAQEGQRRR
jgi:hypothetical protein